MDTGTPAGSDVVPGARGARAGGGKPVRLDVALLGCHRRFEVE
ncbi:hypothetical protein [Methylobacterium sp. 77]|nr:hypothetical protein [Methylobacterium sp. 77]